VSELATRINAVEKASEVFQEGLTRVPTQVQQEVSHLKELHGERFRSIDTQFQERDTRTEQTARDTKTAVDAALQAAKEAVGAQNLASATAIAKSEATTTKQIDQLVTLIQTSITGLDGKITDVKDRLTLIEGRGSGFASSWMIGLGALGGIGTIAGLIALVMALSGR
jgi:hypothetical protein